MCAPTEYEQPKPGMCDTGPTCPEECEGDSVAEAVRRAAGTWNIWGLAGHRKDFSLYSSEMESH